MNITYYDSVSFINCTGTFMEGDDYFEDEFEEEDTELHVSYPAWTYSISILQLPIYS